MSIPERLDKDLKEALKYGETLKLNVIRMIKTMLKNAEVAKMDRLSEEETLDVLVSASKMRKDAIEEYRKGNREDLARKEEEELKLIEDYLPPKLSPDELNKLITETLEKTGASGLKDLGRVMAILIPQVRGRADGKLVNQLVRERLVG